MKYAVSYYALCADLQGLRLGSRSSVKVAINALYVRSVLIYSIL